MSASIRNLDSSRWAMRHMSLRLFASCFIAVAAATSYVCFGPGPNEFIWFANGVLLSFLLLTPRRLWPFYLAVGFAAQASIRLFTGAPWQTVLFLTLLNTTEALLAALLIRRRIGCFRNFASRRTIARFFICGFLVGPLIPGAFYPIYAMRYMHAGYLESWMRWIVADGLGIVVTTPACVAILRTRLGANHSLLTNWPLLTLVLALGPLAFQQNGLLLVLLVYPLLVLVLLRIGLGWAALAALYMTGVGSWYTLHGMGPFAGPRNVWPFVPLIMLQAFIALGIFMLYTLSVILDGRNSAERRLQRIAALHSLVTQNSRDAIIVGDLHGNRRFVSPAAERLTGWTCDEVMKHGVFDLVHPADLRAAREVARLVHEEFQDSSLDCRIRTRSGDYIWVECSLRVVRNREGKPTGVLNLVRDVSERKSAEAQLQEAYRALETLATTDSLTGLANRRHFDKYLAAEWRRAIRDQKPLSMLLVDADFFKSYNDGYGHVRGDSCLKQIANCAADVASRPGDLVARFGGEEYAVVLPETGYEGAMQVASQLHADLAKRRLVHSSNPRGMVTVSIGCATMVPLPGQHPVMLLELADKALYTAKRAGRNCASNPQGEIFAKDDPAEDQTTACGALQEHSLPM